MICMILYLSVKTKMIDFEDVISFNETAMLGIEIIQKLLKAGRSQNQHSRSFNQQPRSNRVMIIKDSQTVRRRSAGGSYTFQTPKVILGFVKCCQLFKVAALNSESGSLSISDAITSRQLTLDSSYVKVEQGDSLVDAYRKMIVHEQTLAIVCDCAKEVGYLRLKDVQQTLLSQYFPVLSSPSLSKVPLYLDSQQEHHRLQIPDIEFDESQISQNKEHHYLGDDIKHEYNTQTICACFKVIMFYEEVFRQQTQHLYINNRVGLQVRSQKNSQSFVQQIFTSTLDKQRWYLKSAQICWPDKNILLHVIHHLQMPKPQSGSIEAIQSLYHINSYNTRLPSYRGDLIFCKSTILSILNEQLIISLTFPLFLKD